MPTARQVLPALACALALLPVSGATAAPQQLIADDGAAVEHGRSLAINGSTAVVGAPGTAGTGAAYVYTLAGGTWVQSARLTAADGDAGDRFGSAVSIDGDLLAVGAEADGPGSVYVFERDPAAGTWTQVQRLADHWNGADDRFGHSVAIHGDRLVVGAPGSDRAAPDGGAAHVFLGEQVQEGRWWWQTEVLPGRDHGGRAGTSVDVDGDTVVVGAPGADPYGQGRGMVSVHRFESHCCTTLDTWLTAGEAGDEIGSSVAISGGTVLAGAPSGGRGAAYAFTRSGSNWISVSELTDTRSLTLGASVALHGDTAVAGDPGSGAAFAFRRDGSTWSVSDRFTAAVAPGLGEAVAVGGAATLVAGGGAAFSFATAPHTDTDAPETTITDAEPASTGDRTADFAFAADGLATFHCSVDGGPWHACGFPYSTQRLEPGAHDFRVRAADEWGNADPTPATASWVLDTVGPQVAIDGPATLLTNAASLSFTGTASDDAGIERVTWSVNGSQPRTATGTTAWSSGSVPLAQGTNRLEVTAIDTAGNATSATVRIESDRHAPVVEIETPSPAPDHLTTAATASVTGTAREYESGLASVTWTSSTGDSGVTTGTERWSTPSIALAPGRNLITVTATDGAGNRGTDTIEIIRDTAAPEIAIVVPTSEDVTTAAGPSINLAGTASDDSGRFHVKWRSASGYGERAWGTSQWSAQVPLALGVNTITVEAEDRFGRTAADKITIVRYL